MNYFSLPGIEMSADAMVLHVCQSLSVGIMQLYSSTRQRNVVEARYIVFYVLFSKYHYTVGNLAKYFGKHHSTISIALSSFKDLYKYNSSFKQKADKFI